MGPDFIEPEVFISYTRNDQLGKTLSLALVDALARASFRGYRDEQQLDPGAAWRPELDSHIESCHAAVVLVTKAALDSPHVLSELRDLLRRWRVAIHHGASFPLFVLLFDGVWPTLEGEWKALLDPINFVAVGGVGAPVTVPPQPPAPGNPVWEDHKSPSNASLHTNGTDASEALTAFADTIVAKLKLQCVSLRKLVAVDGDVETLRAVYGCMENRSKVGTLRNQPGWGAHATDEATLRHVVYDLVFTVQRYEPEAIAGGVGTVGAAGRVRSLGTAYFESPIVKKLFLALAMFLTDTRAARLLRDALKAKIPETPTAGVLDSSLAKLHLQEPESVLLHLRRAHNGLRGSVSEPKEIVHGGRPASDVKLDVVRNEVARIRRKARAQAGLEVALFYLHGAVDPSVLDAIRATCRGNPGTPGTAAAPASTQIDVPALCVLFAEPGQGGVATEVIDTIYDGEKEAALHAHLIVTWDELGQDWPELKPAEESS